MFFKSGVSSTTSVAILSIATAGILSTSDYSTISQNKRIAAQLENVKTLSGAFIKRLNYDGAIVQLKYDTTIVPEVENQKGSIWTLIGNEMCDENDPSCDDWSDPDESIFSPIIISGDTGSISLNTSNIRTLTTGRDASCSYYGPQNGKWTPEWGSNTELLNKALMPCNLFRLMTKGPLGNRLDDNILNIDYKYGEDGSGDETDLQRKITNTYFNIPLHNLITPDNYGSIGPYLLSQIKEIFKDSYYTASIYKNNEDYGLDPTLFLNSDCATANTCHLRLINVPGLDSNDQGYRSAGCDNCIKQDGSNSMVGVPLTFEDITNPTPILVWKSAETDINTEEYNPQIPEVNEVISGIIAYPTNDSIEIRFNDAVDTSTLDEPENNITLKPNSFELELNDLKPLVITSADLTIKPTTLTKIESDLELSGTLSLTNPTPGLNVDITNDNGDLKVDPATSNNMLKVVGDIEAKNKFQLEGNSDTNLDGSITPADDINIWHKDQGIAVKDVFRTDGNKFSIHPKKILTADNDDWIPYPGDDIWETWTSSQKASWARQVPNIYMVTKVITNIMEPFLK